MDPEFKPHGPAAPRLPPLPELSEPCAFASPFPPWSGPFSSRGSWEPSGLPARHAAAPSHRPAAPSSCPVPWPRGHRIARPLAHYECLRSAHLCLLESLAGMFCSPSSLSRLAGHSDLHSRPRRNICGIRRPRGGSDGGCGPKAGTWHLLGEKGSGRAQLAPEGTEGKLCAVPNRQKAGPGHTRHLL